MMILIALGMGILFTLACRWLAYRTGMLNDPNPIVAQHVRPVPYLGGLAIGLAALLAFGLVGFNHQLSPWPVASPSPLVWFGGLVFLLFGLFDDALTFSPFSKLAIQCGLSLTLLLSLHPSPRIALPALPALLLYSFWIVMVVNAVNFTDVCDGLVAGLCCIALAVIALTRPDYATWAWALAGGSAGFLFLNFPPAMIYLGDAGSHFLGYSLAVMTLPGGGIFMKEISPSDLVFGPLLLGVFLFELVFITKMRLNKGLKWWRGSPDHFSLRMQAAGFSKVKTIGLAWAAAIPFAVVAVAFDQHVTGIKIALLSGFLVLECVAAWVWLRNLEAVDVSRVE